MAVHLGRLVILQLLHLFEYSQKPVQLPSLATHWYGNQLPLYDLVEMHLQRHIHTCNM